MTARVHRRALLVRAASLLLSLCAPVRRLFAGGTAVADPLEDFLFALLKHLFPHPDLGDAPYLEVAQAMAAAVTEDPELRSLVADGRRWLDSEQDQPWLKLAAAEQLRLLEQVDARPFFQRLRGLAGVLFYNNSSVWPFFGYEGSSFEKGGYINRGFDDLDWLPDPET